MADRSRRNTIELTVQLMRSNPKARANDILQLLIERGIDRLAAVQLVLLVPLAYGRAGLAGCGIQFSDEYRCIETGEVGQPRKLSALPLWREIVTFARSEVSSGAGGDALLAVAGGSSEIDAINKVLKDGRKVEGLVLSGPVFLWPEFAASIDLGSTARASRKWWEFWR
jgi:hypothetical protein